MLQLSSPLGNRLFDHITRLALILSSFCAYSLSFASGNLINFWTFRSHHSPNIISQQPLRSSAQRRWKWLIRTSRVKGQGTNKERRKIVSSLCSAATRGENLPFFKKANFFFFFFISTHFGKMLQFCRGSYTFLFFIFLLSDPTKRSVSALNYKIPNSEIQVKIKKKP